MTATISTPSDDDKIQHLCHRQWFAGVAVLAALVEYIVRGSRFYQTLMLRRMPWLPPLPPYCGSSCLTLSRADHPFSR